MAPDRGKRPTPGDGRPQTAATVTRLVGPHPSLHPTHLGSYHILETLGEGGMGTVYKAEQDHPRRLVALKVIKPGVVTAEILRRFDRETQVLGRLQHPGIAQIYDAGTTDPATGGQPYFAMEYVDGRPITAHAAAASLTTDARLALLAGVCDAVHHAHQRGVIHRDLKPANILVDTAGQTKVLDFCIARVTDADIQATMQTDVGQLLGTLPYMSPEQVAGDVLDVDTRSDVYTLGVVLYQLLADRLPYEATGRALTEMARVIAEEEPASLRTLDRTLDSDVELIVRKALEKERTRRYQSAAELAADIRRYLAHEPIEARAPTTVYQLRKFARRHVALVGGVAATVVALVIGLAATGYYMVEARAARDRAEEEASKATAINSFLQETLGSANPYDGTGREVTVLEALDGAVERIDVAFVDQPEIRVAIEYTIGSTYRDLGEYDRAAPLLRSALETRQRLGSDPQADVATSLNALGELLYYQGDPDAAAALWQEALEIRQALFGQRHPDVAELLNSLGVAHQARRDYEAAEGMYREALAMRRTLFGDEHEEVANTLNNLAIVRAQDDPAAATPMLREALAIRRIVLGDDHPDVISSLNNLALLLTRLGDYEAAEPLAREALDRWRESLGAQHPRVAAALSNLAELLRNQGDDEAAEPLYREALAMRRTLMGEHADVAANLTDLGALLTDKGEYAAAEAYLREALAMQRRLYGETHSQTQGAVTGLVELYEAWDRPDQAAEYRALIRERDPQD